MMTAMDYITSAFADAWSHEDPQPITPEEAASIISEWTADGIPCPPTVTPRLFAGVWNILYNKHIRKAVS